MRKTIKLIFLAVGMNTMMGCAKESAPQCVDATKFGELIETEATIKVVDVRTPEEFSEGHIPNAININALADDFIENVEGAFPAGSEIAIYCRSGRRSAEAAEKMAKLGYNVTDLEGGILAWEE